MGDLFLQETICKVVESDSCRYIGLPLTVVDSLVMNEVVCIMGSCRHLLHGLSEYSGCNSMCFTVQVA
jgi:hypothetical protein